MSVTGHTESTPCFVCEKPVVGFEPEYCCSGQMCGCMGMPIYPPLCSQECSLRLHQGGRPPKDSVTDEPRDVSQGEQS
jgi:hypothetical protein